MASKEFKVYLEENTSLHLRIRGYININHKANYDIER